GVRGEGGYENSKGADEGRMLRQLHRNTSVELVALLRSGIAYGGDHRRVERVLFRRRLFQFLRDVLSPVFIELADFRLQFSAFFLRLGHISFALRRRHLLHLRREVFRVHFVEIDRAAVDRVDDVPRRIRIHGRRLRDLALHVGRRLRREVLVLRGLTSFARGSRVAVADVGLIQLRAEDGDRGVLRSGDLGDLRGLIDREVTPVGEFRAFLPVRAYPFVLRAAEDRVDDDAFRDRAAAGGVEVDAALSERLVAGDDDQL